MATTKQATYILGLSFYYHDSAAALLKNGVVVAAAQEERFSRIKHDEDFPQQAIMYCLQHENISIDDVNFVVFYEKPILKFERLLKTYIQTWPRGVKSFCNAMLSLFGKKIWVENKIRKETKYAGEILYTKHHVSHAASAYYCSPYNDAAIVTIDGVGEWDTTTIAKGEGCNLATVQSIHFPDSLGLLYSAITQFIGFKVNSAEYKVMGLAPYGNPDVFYNHFKKIITIKKDGSYQLNQKYFAYQYGLQMTTKKLEELFGVPIRVNESELTQVHKDIAAALQKITEEVVLAIAVHAKKITGSNSICLAGGVALNCVANGKLQEANIFDNVYIQPASGDAGSAVGAALYVHHHVLQNKKGDTDAMPDVYLGTEFTAVEIEQALQKYNFTFTQLSDTELFTAVADYINGTNAIGWFQGRMEYGPRALGNRSIIADPRNKENWQKINKKIKFRESFRPFAPAVLAEYAHTYFSIKTSSPYMLLVGKVLVDTLPAITHVDGSARIQTVHKETNKTFHSLLEAFYKKTGCPVLINTSFNVRGEPIVHSPSDAISSFINTEMDYLVLGNFVVARSENEQVVEKYRDTEEYLKIFELD